MCPPFVAIEMLGDPQQHLAQDISHKFANGWTVAFYFISLPGVLIFFQLFSAMSKFMRSSALNLHDDQAHNDSARTGRHSHADHEGHDGSCPVGQHKHSWEEISVEAETEASAIAFGFFMKQFVWSMIAPGKAIPLDCDYDVDGCGESISFFTLIILSIMGFLFVVVLFTAKLAKLYERYRVVTKTLDYLKIHFNMAFAWVTLWGVRFLIEEYCLKKSLLSKDSQKIMSPVPIKKAFNLMFFWPLFIIATFALDKMSDKGLLDFQTTDKIITGLSLTVAVMFEKTFSSALETIILWKTAGLSPMMVTFLVASSSLAVLLLLIPAWLWYIAPIAMKPVPRN